MEHRRVRITSYASSSPEQVAALHPFTQQERRFISSNLAYHLYPFVLPQLDVVFPSSDVLESTLSKLGTRYFRGKAKLSEIVDYAIPFASSLPTPNMYVRTWRVSTSIAG
jgi:ribonuclease P/MRP protein subunit RPP40